VVFFSSSKEISGMRWDNLCKSLLLQIFSWTIDSNFLSPSMLWKNISWYYLSDPWWNVLFLSTYRELRQRSYDSSSWKVDISISKNALSPQAKFTWYFDLFHKHPCSFLIFEASIVTPAEGGCTEFIGLCGAKEKILSLKAELLWLQLRLSSYWSWKRQTITICLENVKQLSRGIITFYRDKQTPDIKSRGQLFQLEKT